MWANLKPRPPNQQTACPSTTCWWSWRKPKLAPARLMCKQRSPTTCLWSKEANMKPRPPKEQTAWYPTTCLWSRRPMWCEGRQTSKQCALRQLVHDQGGQYDDKAAKRAYGVLSGNLLMIKERPIWCHGRQTSKRCALRQLVDDQGEANMMTRPPNEQTVCSPTTCWWSRRAQYDAKAAKRANGVLSDNLLMIKERPIWCQGRQTSIRCALRQLVDDQGEANMMTRPPNEQTVCSPTSYWWSRRGQTSIRWSDNFAKAAKRAN